jgi:hypothetical protein
MQLPELMWTNVITTDHLVLSFVNCLNGLPTYTCTYVYTSCTFHGARIQTNNGMWNQSQKIQTYSNYFK